MRFKTGDLAIFMVAQKKSGVPYQGSIVEVIQVGPFKKGEMVRVWKMPRDADYLLRDVSGDYGIASDWQLAKIDPPAEPTSLTRSKENEHV